jgi:hypothetical protein
MQYNRVYGHTGHPFTTYDRDNDSYSGNCAVSYMGPFWYTACHNMNPFGDWGNTSYAKASCHFVEVGSNYCYIMSYFAWGFRSKR